MEAPGLWFLAECRNPHCPIYKEAATLYIGCNRSFHFEKESRLCMCGACGLRLPSIHAVIFRTCMWSYRGQMTNCQPEESREQIVDDIATFPEEKQVLAWDWLVFTVQSQHCLKPSKETQTSAQQAAFRSLEAQTELLVTLPEHTPNLPGGVIGNEVLDTIIARLNRYKAKYKELKQTSGYKKGKRQAQ